MKPRIMVDAGAFTSPVVGEVGLHRQMQSG